MPRALNCSTTNSLISSEDILVSIAKIDDRDSPLWVKYGGGSSSTVSLWHYCLVKSVYPVNPVLPNYPVNDISNTLFTCGKGLCTGLLQSHG